MVNLTLKLERSLNDFKPLKPAEEKLLEACQIGKEEDKKPEKPPEEENNQNIVRAAFLRFLALGGDESIRVHERGVRLWGARVKGELNLEGASLPHSLELFRCHLDSKPILQDSHIHGFISFEDCHINGLIADRMVCNGSVFLTGKFFKSTDTVRLQGAQIGSNLECDGGTFCGNDDDALKYENAVIKGSVFLRGGFTANGRVSMIGVQIGGSLDCRGAELNRSQSGNELTRALTCDGAVIQGNVYLTKMCIGTRKVVLANSLTEIDSYPLWKHFIAKATVSLVGAQIGGNLECSGAQLEDMRVGNKHEGALVCDNAVIKGAVLLNENFTTTGRVSLSNAQIGKDINCKDSEIKAPKCIDEIDYALIAQGMTVAGIFMIGGEGKIEGKVSLITAKVGSLADDDKAWQDKKLYLDGFVYDKLAWSAPTDAKARIAWLGKQSKSDAGLDGDGKDFKSQPWRQLQKVLREMGYIEDARQVGIAFEERLRKANLIGQTPENWWQLRRDFTRILSCRFHWLFGWLIGYGYRPLGLFFKMFAVWFVFGIIYWLAAVYGNNGNGVFAPSNPLVFQNSEYCVCVPDSYAAKVEKAKPANSIPLPIQGAGNWYLCEKLRAEYTGFSPFAYSLDLILPLVDLQQENDWAPMIPTATKASAFWTCSRNWEYAIRFLMWFEILFGWVASLLLVAVFSGLTKRRDE